MGPEAGHVVFLSQEVLRDLSDDDQSLVLERLSAYNPKLRVNRMLPFPGDESFSIAKRTESARFALIAEARGEVLTPDLVQLAPDEGTVASEDGAVIRYRAVVYMFVSPPDLAWRNVFVTQTIFPGLCALIDEMRTAPGIAFSAHPVYFLDLASESTPSSVRRTLMLFTSMGTGYVSLRRADFDPMSVPRDLDRLLQDAGDQRAGRPYYSVDAQERILTFTTSQFNTNGLLSADDPPTKWNFKGSQDKFYWSEVLPVAVVAAHSGYRIDCSEVVAYLARVRSDAEAVHHAKNLANAKVGKKPKEVKLSNKFNRTVALFDYIEKISEI